jgi:hypothetical protein
MVKGVAVAAFALVTQGAYSQVPVTVHVTKLDPTYMGAINSNGSIAFKVDQDVQGCLVSNPNHYLLYIGPTINTPANPMDTDRMLTNSQAVLSTLQLALINGNKVELTVYPISGNFCPVSPVRLLNTF